MRIDVIGDDRVSSQARTYAEYRVFAALTQCERAAHVRHVRVSLQSLSAGADCEDIACSVTVAIEGSEVWRIRATGPHAYAAINRAIERLETNAAATGLLDRISF